jgi:membrane protein implicated in regulation of membrane protease activity
VRPSDAAILLMCRGVAACAMSMSEGTGEMQLSLTRFSAGSIAVAVAVDIFVKEGTEEQESRAEQQEVKRGTVR